MMDSDDERLRELRRLVPAGFAVYGKTITREEAGENYDDLVSTLKELWAAWGDEQNIGFVMHGSTLITVVNLDADISEQVDADTCDDHRAFCCPACFDLTAIE